MSERTVGTRDSGFGTRPESRVAGSDEPRIPSLESFANVWRADSLGAARCERIPSGFAQLDAALGGGWPKPALIELLTDKEGIGELQMLLPLLRRLTESAQQSIVLCVNPPQRLYAPALQQHGVDPHRCWTTPALSPRNAAWAMETAIRSGACCAVLGWLREARPATLRRLKLATSVARTIGVIFRGTQAAHTPSPATVRAALDPHAPCLHVDLLKVQGRKQSTAMLDVRARIESEAPP